MTTRLHAVQDGSDEGLYDRGQIAVAVGRAGTSVARWTRADGWTRHHRGKVVGTLTDVRRLAAKNNVVLDESLLGAPIGAEHRPSSVGSPSSTRPDANRLLMAMLTEQAERATQAEVDAALARGVAYEAVAHLAAYDDEAEVVESLLERLR
jgi:hypothetical protein